jgi:predicted 3-demethylubiquinone-9 3-methyltransferase (glyoxalase superfamily)
MTSAQKITPCLWFDFNADEAVAHYLSIFKNSRIVATTRYSEVGPGPAGAVLTILFEIEGQRILALNGGPQFTFTPALSLIVDCADQAEVDALWDKLSEGGAPGQCGWLTDKFGVSWQVVPRVIPQMLQSDDPAAIRRVMREVMAMKKLDAVRLQQAFEAN